MQPKYFSVNRMVTNFQKYLMKTELREICEETSPVCLVCLTYLVYATLSTVLRINKRPTRLRNMKAVVDFDISCILEYLEKAFENITSKK